MNKQRIQLVSLGIFFLAQLAFLGNMVLQNEDVLEEGTTFKFRIDPIDPNDPFRGKYVTLRFHDNTYQGPFDKNSLESEEVFVIVKEDAEGFARIGGFQATASADQPSVKITQKDFYLNIQGEVVVKFPFDRFYMEESKAPKAEKRLRRRFDEEHEAYALVSVKAGKAVLKDVYVDGVSLKEWVE